MQNFKKRYVEYIYICGICIYVFYTHTKYKKVNDRGKKKGDRNFLWGKRIEIQHQKMTKHDIQVKGTIQRSSLLQKASFWTLQALTWSTGVCFPMGPDPPPVLFSGFTFFMGNVTGHTTYHQSPPLFGSSWGPPTDLTGPAGNHHKQIVAIVKIHPFFHNFQDKTFCLLVWNPHSPDLAWQEGH